MKQMTMKQTREAIAFLSVVDMMHVEGLAAGTINENAARIEYKAQGGRPVRYIHISSRAHKANLDAIAAAVAEAIGAERWAEIVAVVTGEEVETETAEQIEETETEETTTETIEETAAPAEEQTTETETEEEETETPATPGEMLKVRNVIMGRGGYRERELLKAPHTMTHGETWNEAHKVVEILATTPDPDGYRPGCAVDIVTRAIVG